MYIPPDRQALLPALRRQSRTTQPRISRSTWKPQHQRYALYVLAAIFLGIVIAYLFLPTSLKDFKARDSSESQQDFDSEHELNILNNQPSREYCAYTAEGHKREPLVIAHGGDSDASPPNTLSGFLAALNIDGVKSIEVDVSMTKDGQLVALHDRDLTALVQANGRNNKRKTPAPRRSLLRFWQRSREPMAHTADYTWDEIKELSWGRLSALSHLTGSQSRVALFTDVLKIMIPRQTLITVDVKLREGFDEREESEVVANAVYNALEAARCGLQCMVWAKNDLVASTLKSLAPLQRVGLVVQNETADVRAAGYDEPLRMAHIRPEVAGVHYEMASRELTEKIRAAGREVHVWTANTAAMMSSALDAVPDAIVTSHPRKLIEALKRRRAACEINF